MRGTQWWTEDVACHIYLRTDPLVPHSASSARLTHATWFPRIYSGDHLLMPVHIGSISPLRRFIDPLVNQSIH